MPLLPPPVLLTSVVCWSVGDAPSMWMPLPERPARLFATTLLRRSAPAALPIGDVIRDLVAVQAGAAALQGEAGPVPIQDFVARDLIEAQVGPIAGVEIQPAAAQRQRLAEVEELRHTGAVLGLRVRPGRDADLRAGRRCVHRRLEIGVAMEDQRPWVAAVPIGRDVEDGRLRPRLRRCD